MNITAVQQWSHGVSEYLDAVVISTERISEVTKRLSVGRRVQVTDSSESQLVHHNGGLQEEVRLASLLSGSNSRSQSSCVVSAGNKPHSCAELQKERKELRLRAEWKKQMSVFLGYSSEWSETVTTHTRGLCAASCDCQISVVSV